MLVKYQIDGNPMPLLTQIGDVSLEGGTMILAAASEHICNIIVKTVSFSEYQEYIRELYEYGKLDLTKTSHQICLEADDWGGDE